MITLTPEIISYLDKRGLTPREKEVCGYLLNFTTLQQIADFMFIGRSAVKGHITNINDKLGFKNTRSVMILLFNFLLHGVPKSDPVVAPPMLENSEELLPRGSSLEL